MKIAHGYGGLPLSFERNEGQTDNSVKFLAKGQGYGIFLTSDGAVISLGRAETGKSELPSDMPNDLRRPPRVEPAEVVRMELIDARPAIPITGEDLLPGTINYLIGNDQARWHPGIKTYARVKYAGVYPGVDLIYYGNQKQLEYDFVVAPGASAKLIGLRFRGAKQLKLNADGDLRVIGQYGEIAFHKPDVYQMRGGKPWPVEANMVLLAGNEVSFRMGSYDPSLPLVIDPVLAYSTYFGGSFSDRVQAIAVDASGNAYVTGTSHSLNLPVTAGAFQTANPSKATPNATAFIAKLNSTGSAVLYATYLGGSGSEEGFGIAVNQSGDAYVTGASFSTDFPATPGAYQTANNAAASGKGNVFVSELSSDGSSLIYSTLVGGTGASIPSGIVLDGSGNAYIAGTTSGNSGFPITPGAFQSGNDKDVDFVFATKLNTTGTALEYSTLLGGSVGSHANAVAINSAGNVYVAGSTFSKDFPVTPNAFQVANPNTADNANSGPAFITELNPTGTAVVYSTYLGGTVEDSATSIAVDRFGDMYVAGATESPDFPVTYKALQYTQFGIPNLGAGAGFVTVFSPGGTSLRYSTLLGGNNGRSAVQGIVVDDYLDVNVTGYTSSTDFPITCNAFQSINKNPHSNGTMFFTELNLFDPTVYVPVYSTYLGGSGEADIPTGIAMGDYALVGGYTQSTDFPVTAGAFQRSNHASSSAPSPDETGFTTSLVTYPLSPVPPANVSILPLGGLVFGSWPIGSTSESQEQTVVNTSGSDDTLAGCGPVPIHFSSITVVGANPSSFAVSNSCGGNSGGTLPLDSSCTISVSFTPKAVGRQSAFVTVTDYPATSPQTFEVFGMGTAGPSTSLSLSTTSLGFGDWATGFPTPSQEVVVTNTGSSSDVYFKSISVTGANASSFQAPNSCIEQVPYSAPRRTLAPGASCKISVIFNPVAVGPQNASITLVDNATTSAQTINLSGTGINAPTASLSLSATKLNFGNWIALGSPAGAFASPSQDIIVKNTSETAAVYFKSISVTGVNASSFLAPNSCGYAGGRLAPKDSCRISAVFSPVASGAQSASIQLVDNATMPAQTIDLSGTGINAPTASLSLSATNLEFGSKDLGFSTPSQQVVVTNTSKTSVLYFKSISVTGLNASSFRAPNSCGYAGGKLAPGASCRISAIFTPAVAGAQSAIVELIDNASTSPQIISLSGTGVNLGDTKGPKTSAAELRAP